MKTIKRGKETITETRYYISSLKPNIELFAKAVRQHWSVEVMHWHLDVTFKEDANKTLDKIAAQNTNILRKWALSILKTVDFVNKKQSLSLKRYMINTNPKKYLAIILEMQKMYFVLIARENNFMRLSCRFVPLHFVL